MAKWYVWNSTNFFFAEIVSSVEAGDEELIEANTPEEALNIGLSYWRNVEDDEFILYGNWYVLPEKHNSADEFGLISDVLAKKNGVYFYPCFSTIVFKRKE